MPVMAAHMASVRHGGTPERLTDLVNRQSIQFGAEQQGFARFRAIPHRRDAVATKAGDHLIGVQK